MESATQKELDMLEEGGYDLPEWGDKVEGYEESQEDEQIDSDAD